MSATLFYYTGTGNSLWVARKIAERLGETELFPMANFKNQVDDIHSDTIGLIFPVYIWGVPAPVLRFVEFLKTSGADYIFAVAVNGGQVAGTLLQLKKVMAKHGQTLSAGFQITTPSNYIPWGGPGSREKQNGLFEKAEGRISLIADKVKEKQILPVERGPLWQRLLFSGMYKMSFKHVPQMDKQFWVDEKCDHCSICSKICPAGNITMDTGVPVWNHRCEQCLACIQWCPRESIQYGKKTPHYERYHHPEIALKDILRSR